MELHPQTRGYEIKEAKIPITITMRSLDSLKPHEEVVQEELIRLSQSIQSDRVLRHPIVADIETGIVLDGTHRLLALRQLGYRAAPAALVDYRSPAITIEKWFRTIQPATLVDAMKALEPVGLVIEEQDPSVAIQMLNKKSIVAVVEDDERAFTFAPRVLVRDSLEMIRAGFLVESALRANGHSINYLDSRPSLLADKTLLLSMIKLEKREVVATAMSGRLYPPKSTRHLIPSRPLGTRVPVEWLELDNIEESQSRLMKHLKSMKLTRLHEGSIVGSRRYAEEVFQFG